MKNLKKETQIHRGIQHKLTEMFEDVEGKTYEEEGCKGSIEVDSYEFFLDIVSDVIRHERIDISIEEKEQYKIDEHNTHLRADIGYD